MNTSPRLPTDDIMDLPLIRRACRKMANMVVALDRKINGPEPRQPDFSYVDHGSIILLRPLTRAAWNWIGDHVPDYALFGGAIPVERRYFPDMLDGIDADGLTFID